MPVNPKLFKDYSVTRTRNFVGKKGFYRPSIITANKSIDAGDFIQICSEPTTKSAKTALITVTVANSHADPVVVFLRDVKIVG